MQGVDSNYDPAASKFGTYASAEEAEAWIGGFWVIDAPNLDLALELAGQGSKA